MSVAFPLLASPYLNQSSHRSKNAPHLLSVIPQEEEKKGGRLYTYTSLQYKKAKYSSFQYARRLVVFDQKLREREKRSTNHKKKIREKNFCRGSGVSM
jgi:hypothetical protein